MRIDMVADRKHITVLSQGIARKGTRGIRRRGQNVAIGGDTYNIGRVPTASALGVIGVDRAPSDGRDGIFDESGLVDGVGVDRNLHIILVSNAQTGINCRWSGPPVLVQFQPTGAGAQLLGQRLARCRITLAKKTEVDGPVFGRLQHTREVPRAGRAGCGVGSGSWPGPTPEHGGYPVSNGFIDLLR